MKVLLTGASGFVGSRILARLHAQSIPTALLLRPSSSRHLIQPFLQHADLRPGALDDPPSLAAALADVTHVIHSAGLTKATRTSEFTRVNAEGTRNLLIATHRHAPNLQRFIHLSSLAAVGPSLPSAPAREQDPPHPVSAYGRSKLAGEAIVRQSSPCPALILRPPGVYGPGDRDFLQLFRAARARVLPQFGGGRQPHNLVFADDLAAVIVACLHAPLPHERVFHVAHPHVVTAAQLSQEVARQSGVRALLLPLPKLVLTLLALGGELRARLTGHASILGWDRRRELQAPGWVCDVSLLRDSLGLECPTPLPEGIARTLHWYREQQWL